MKIQTVYLEGAKRKILQTISFHAGKAPMRSRLKIQTMAGQKSFFATTPQNIFFDCDFSNL